jgi:glycosyltransferase involved in cell wall biosynthesis
VVLGTHQGCPNAVLEAMAAAVPVIANDSGGTRELVANGTTGWLLPEEATCEAIASAMRSACGDAATAGAMGVRAREHVRRRHTIEAMADGYLRILAPENAAAHEKITAWIPAPESPPTFASPASNR